MIDKRITRGSEKIGDNKFRAWTRQEFVNGDGFDVGQENWQIFTTKEQIKKILKNDIPQQKKKHQEDIKKQLNNIDTTKKRLKGLTNKKGYKQFLETLENKQYKKLIGIKKLEEEGIDVSDLINEKEYAEFKEKIESDEFKKNYITYMDEQNLNKMNEQLESLNKTSQEIDMWEKQFLDMLKNWDEPFDIKK